MRSCLIFGSGRSGTSMVAGLFADGRWFQGHQSGYIEPRDSNPKGFFEDRDVNQVNEEILAGVPGSDDLRQGQRWLLALPASHQPIVAAGDWVSERIAALTANRPFCFKDPRFSYTLGTWMPHIDDAALICVFREPSATAHSIVKECASAAYLSSVGMTFERALDIWTDVYDSALYWHSRVPVLLVHYDQVLDGSALPRLGEAVGADLDAGFPDVALKRSPSEGPVTARAADLYRRMCEMAGMARR